jgi:rare lipoprotein A
MASIYLRALSAAALAASLISSPVSAATAKTNVVPGNCGKASWYALSSRTASGERMNATLHTAAHRSLRFGTKVRVTNSKNGKSVVVRINDRGPFIRGRVLDISKVAASDIGMIKSGVGRICYQVVG